jgi:hypothetical protein
VWLAWIGLAATVGTWPAGGATFVSTGATWRYVKGTAEASTPVNAWRQVGFADGGWAVGAAPFHYGYPEVTGGTLLPDMRRAGNNPGYASVFLRHTFTVSHPSSVGALRLRAICDDGFIAWINGVEVARYNLPAGERAYNTFASAAVPEPLSWLEFDLPAPTYLLDGQNVLAVQVFNTSITSSDLQWDGELFSPAPDLEPPRVAAVEPAPGAVEQLTQVTVTFTEPVVGVRAADLFLGAESATAVSGSGAVYVFTFASPGAGPIELRWDADARITDLAVPANAFDPLTAGPWRYEVVDRTPPVVAEWTPRPGLTVRRLAQVEVRFSEPVQGVDAADLLVNGVAAQAVSGELAGPYRFEFTEPPPGDVQFTWATDHGIRDLADPPNSLAPQAWSVVLDPNYTVPSLRINEFLASNLSATGLKDEDGELQDWIEIYNSSPEAVNLEGWSLTDERDDPGRWVFPAVTLGPGQYLVVFASGKDRRPTGPGARLHTNFKLGPEGEYLALLDHESPRVAVSEFAPAYPEQRNDYSYGVDASAQLRYFRTPTPGAPNGSSAIQGVVPPPHVNVGRGRFDAPFTLIVSSPLPGVTLRYTTDGSEPSASNGQLYTGPLHIERTTTFRVAGFAENFLPSRPVTHSYLFLNDVPTQPNNPPGYPSTWGTHGQFPGGSVPADYEMDLDPLRVDPNNPASPVDPQKMQRLKEGLLEWPIVSLVLNRDDMFGPGGLYPRSSSGNKSPNEKACSVEMLLPDGAAAIRAFASGGSPGQSNAATSAPGVILNEVLTDDGRGGGWVELFNRESVTIALAGYSLAVQPGGGAWEFPAGTQLAASAHLMVRCRAAPDAAGAGGGTLSSDLALDARGGRVALRDPAGVELDAVAFGFQIAGQSIGRAAGEWRLLTTPTPGAANATPAALGPASTLRFNEWLAAQTDGADWFELFNTDTRPVNLSGLFLSDDPALGAQRKFQVRPLSFIAPHGWVAFAADGRPGDGPDHVNFSLDQLGEALRLYDAEGALIDAIDFGPQSPGVSEGRLTDGGSQIGVLTVGPTRGASNTPSPGELDRDRDGLPDAWEIAHGTDPAVPDGDGDPDGDGLTNAQEFLAGTHPNDAASRLSLAVTALSPASITLAFVARADRSYSILFKQSVEDSAWTRLVDVPAEPEDRVETVVDPVPAAGARFYRLVTPARP